MTRVRLRAHWILLLALGVAAAWVLQLRRGPTSPVRSDALGPEEGLAPLKRVVFQAEGDSIVVVLEGEEYWITHPLRDRVDSFFMNELKRQVEQLRPRRVLPDSSGARYALDPPLRRLWVEDIEGKRWGLALGDSSPVASEIYARRLLPRGGVVLLEGFSTRKYFGPPLSTIRDAVAAPLLPGPIDSLAVLSGDTGLRARRESRELWVAQQPPGLRVDPVRINSVVQALRSPTITGYPADTISLAALGLDPPHSTWVLFQGSRAESVRVGRLMPGRQEVCILPSSRSEPAFIGGEIQKGLLGGWPALADLHLISIPAESIRAVEFLRPAAGAYAREGKRWVRRPSGRAVEQLAALETELRNLTALQWTEYPVQERRPRVGAEQIALRVESAARAETLLLASPEGDEGLARSTGRPRWGRISTLPFQMWRYRAAHPE